MSLFHDPFSPPLSASRHFHCLNISVLFHKPHLVMILSAPILLWSPQWDGAPVLPPNTDRAGDAHQGQWTESVHLPEAGAGSGLPQQTPRLLQLSLHLLPGTSSSRRAQRTQTRKLSQRGGKKVFFQQHFRKEMFLQWWTLSVLPLSWGCWCWFSLEGRESFCPFFTYSLLASPCSWWWPLKAARVRRTQKVPGGH